MQLVEQVIIKDSAVDQPEHEEVAALGQFLVQLAPELENVLFEFLLCDVGQP